MIKRFQKSPFDVDEICAFMSGPDGGGSHERPSMILAWAGGIEGEEAGRAFWSVVRREWSTFDRIPHDAFARLFAKFAAQWASTPEIDALPEQMTLYRGQSRDAVPGLSWTLDRAIADGFAQGHRSIAVQKPTVLERQIRRSEVAIAILDERNEREVVLWR